MNAPPPDPETASGRDGPSVILVAVDGSTTSLRAGAYAAGLARRQHSQLIMVTVTTTSSLGGLMPEAMAAGAQFAAQAADELRAMAQEAADRLGLHARFLECHGDPMTEIMRAADRYRVDAVVVGASASPGHRFVGSLANRLVRAGKWPVTVVP
ncbi:universal stress protein [Pseudonocardia sp. KRD291]|uniref:universal stress protein n=1 Tax=Pseudonocardia sp. KRD291 TaxID=2792007 RepID=UPI001C49DFB4|nr:universal stress protein [Pseudonocardia sp. KRD291]MBW0102726.1 universal stress protein [Pseudonocardia sp. KRD291]